ncbi:MAG: N-acetyltransferase [Hymenobacteraceae bacterium]|nr:N-acetyltransferase [Hymenobacteraceae bacterium]
MEIRIVHEQEDQQFTVKLEKEDAELAYATPSEKVMNFTHTYVPVHARGKGVAYKLIEEGLCYARENGFSVIASCPVVAKHISRNPHHQDLLKQKK